MDFSDLQAVVSPAAAASAASTVEGYLLHHYVHSASRVLINVESTSNPLRNVVIPRAATSAALMNALYANSAFHVSVGNPDSGMRTSSLMYYDRAASALSQMIAEAGSQTTTENLEVLLLTAVLLCK